MLIDDIKPYERNARHNEKAIPVVAESIKEFGLRGQIVLESRENPVIVCGHTRWAACKHLGWTEIPDEKIDYCDGLDDEQIKAFRLADNRTGEVATWNKALLKSEMRLLDKSKMDMSRFKFDFKSKSKVYGQERLRTDDYYNLRLVNIDDCDPDTGMPEILPCDELPNELLPFNYAKSTDNHDCWLHFFVDDYQFERLWNKPEKYLPLLKQFKGVLSPDFSLYMDMPLPMQRWNEYRRRALANYWQSCGLNVIPTLSLTNSDSYEFCFGGIAEGSTVAVSTVGIKNDEMALSVFFHGMNKGMDVIKPKTVIQYGGDIGFDYGEANVINFRSNTSFKS